MRKVRERDLYEMLDEWDMKQGDDGSEAESISETWQGLAKEYVDMTLSYNQRTGKARIIWHRAWCEWRSRCRNT